MLNEIPSIPYNCLLPQYSWIKKFENDVIQAMVRSSPSEKWVEWKGVRIPLPNEVDLPEGTWVQIRFSQTSKGYDMNMAILRESITDTSPEKVSELLTGTRSNISDKNNVIQNIVQKIVSRNPELMGKTDFLLKVFHEWFNERNLINHLFLRMGNIVQEAVEKGVIDTTWLKLFSNFISFPLDGEIHWQIIRDFFKEQVQNIVFEKQLFRSGDIKTNIQNSIAEIKDYRILQTLLKNELFVDFLKTKGYYQDFQETLDTFYSKITAHQLLNLSNPNYNYIICELPVNIKDGFSRLCIHNFYSGKQEQGKSKKSQYAIIAFDIELVNTGKMWIELRWLEGMLECLFKIAEGKTKEMCNQFLGELENNFKLLGLNDVSICVENWDGDRISSIFSLLESIENKGWTV